MSEPKNDFLTALQCKELPSNVPLWELHFHLWSKLSGGKFVSGKDFLSLSTAEQDKAICQDADVMVEIGQEIGFSAVSIPDGLWDCIYTLPPKYRYRLIKELKKRKPNFCVVAATGGVIAMPSEADGYVEFCYRLYDDPEGIDKLCEEYYSGFEMDAENMLEAGVDAMYIPADVADTRAPFFNIEQCERWYFPYLRKCAAYMKERGIHPILHTDGNVNLLLPYIRESGVEGLQAIDPVSGMDIAKTQEILAPNVAVCGNLDCGLMLNGKPEEIYNSACEIINKCKSKPGFVFGNSNAVVIDTPIENYKAMVSAWRDCRKIS